MPRITISLNGKLLPASSGQRLLDAILGAGIEHRHICGGNGFCTSCRVEVVACSPDTPPALSPVSPLERDRLGREAGRLRLACQTFVLADVSLQVPRAPSRFSPDDD